MADTPKNTGYANFYLANEFEDLFNSHLDLQSLFTVNRDLELVPGMTVKINKYTATKGKTEMLDIGAGNTKTIVASYTQTPYTVKTLQNRFEYHDEELMGDPLVIQTGLTHQATDMFNYVNSLIYAALKTHGNTPITGTDPFDAFVDALAAMNIEDNEGRPAAFALLSNQDVAWARKGLKNNLQYVEAFARQGYIGSVCSVPLYIKKDASPGEIIVATKKAATLFLKKGTEVEAVDKNNRSETAANVRLNTVFLRKYAIAALTDATKVQTIAVSNG